MRAIIALASVVVSAAVLAGCGGSDSAEPAAEVSDPVTLAVTIDEGTVSPINERLEAAVGQPITVTVDSDAEDELHVHSVPDHEFEIAAGEGQVFEFTVDVPGQVDLELHHLDKTIATVLVRP